MLKFHPIRLLAFTLLTTTIHAQMHRVEAPEKVTRSVGVYEWTGDLAKPTAARLVPVSLFIDNAFKDGGSYYARPIPLALLDGNIYSLEKAGIPQGTITLDYARHLQSSAAGSEDSTNLGWFGYGTFATMPVARKPRPLQASTTPAAIISSKDDDRPTFVRRNTSNTTSSTTPASGNKTPSSTTASTPAPDDDPDRPRFSKPPATTPTTTSPTTPSSTTTTPSTTPTTTPDAGKQEDTSPTTTRDPVDDTDRPTLRHRDPKQAEADRKARAHGSVTAAPGALNDDPDRPNMRRGRTAGIGGAPAPQLSGLPAELHQMVAVSDPVTHEPHPFTRDWDTPTERAEVLEKLEAVARTQLAGYDSRSGIQQSAPPPATRPTPRSSTGAHRNSIQKAPSAPIQLAPLTGEDIASYTLSYGGLPTFVYTAISAPPASPSAPTLPERYVTVVAQKVPSGELQVAFTSVTDAAHLDRTPWFRLIDAVDPDSEHRASLLFELRGHTSRQFALYRILSATAEQIFVTNPTD